MCFSVVQPLPCDDVAIMRRTFLWVWSIVSAFARNVGIWLHDVLWFENWNQKGNPFFKITWQTDTELGNLVILSDYIKRTHHLSCLCGHCSLSWFMKWSHSVLAALIGINPRGQHSTHMWAHKSGKGVPHMWMCKVTVVAPHVVNWMMKDVASDSEVPVTLVLSVIFTSRSCSYT